ncbi:MAG: hypothetical protein AAF327_07375 [Cyanobacteria bacterium P01_A01_bin.37]
MLAAMLAIAETETNFRPRDEDGGYCGEYGSDCYYVLDFCSSDGVD